MQRLARGREEGEGFYSLEEEEGVSFAIPFVVQREEPAGHLLGLVIDPFPRPQQGRGLPQLQQEQTVCQ